jgi:hypothetical protein
MSYSTSAHFTFAEISTVQWAHLTNVGKEKTWKDAKSLGVHLLRLSSSSMAQKNTFLRIKEPLLACSYYFLPG